LRKNACQPASRDAKRRLRMDRCAPFFIINKLFRSIFVNKQIIKSCGLSLVVSSILLFVIWFIHIGIFYKEIISSNYIDIFRTQTWIIMNSIILFIILIITYGIFGIYLIIYKKTLVFGLISFVIFLIGFVLFISNHFYETYLWPVIANESKEAFIILQNDKLLGAVYNISTFIWFIGILLFSINMLISKEFPKYLIVLWFIGGSMFGLGLGIYLRTIGLIPFLISMFFIGIKVLKKDLS
jgi:hypothetical protein